MCANCGVLDSTGHEGLSMSSRIVTRCRDNVYGECPYYTAGFLNATAARLHAKEGSHTNIHILVSL